MLWAVGMSLWPRVCDCVFVASVCDCVFVVVFVVVCACVSGCVLVFASCVGGLCDCALCVVVACCGCVVVDQANTHAPVNNLIENHCTQERGTSAGI